MVKAKGAIIPGLRRGSLRPTGSLREIKMLRPICATCQRGQDVPQDWWKNCTHNPYVSISQNDVKVPKYEDLGDGKKKLVGTDTISEWFERPNWVPVALDEGINSGQGVIQKRTRHGFILPHELVSPEFPEGIAPCCEFRNCYWQEGLQKYRQGSYCREQEARLIGHFIRQNSGGGALEVGVGPQSAEKQRRQLDEVPI